MPSIIVRVHIGASTSQLCFMAKCPAQLPFEHSNERPFLVRMVVLTTGKQTAKIDVASTKGHLYKRGRLTKLSLVLRELVASKCVSSRVCHVFEAVWHASMTRGITEIITVLRAHSEP